MYMEAEYKERCAARGLSEAAVGEALAVVAGLDAAARGPDGTLRHVPLAAVEAHIARAFAAGSPPEATLLALARYFTVLGLGEKEGPGGAGATGAAEAKAHLNGLVARLLAYLSPIGILDAMSGRLAALEGEEIRARVMAGVAIPPAGAPPEAYPPATAAFVAALGREAGPERARRVLAWNVHGIPPEAFAGERTLFLAAPSIQAWLDGYHARQVAVLERHAADGTLWFEQRITPPRRRFRAGTS